MSIWNKNNLIRVYACNGSYVLHSENNKEEKLQIAITKSTTSICVNQLSNDEWNSLIASKTNSVSSPSAACVFNGYGCLGLLSTSMYQIQQEVQQQLEQQQQQKNNNSKNNFNDDINMNQMNHQQQANRQIQQQQLSGMQYFLIFVKEAESVGTVKNSEIMRITDVFILPLNTDLNTNTYTSQQNYNQVQSLRTYIDDIR